MQHILFFAGNNLKAFALSQGRLLHCTVFEPSESGRLNFASYINEQVNGSVRLLVDLIEEDFHTGTVPHVIGRDRKELQQRLLNKYFRGSEHRYIALQGRQKRGRKVEGFLVAGINDSGLLKPWLRILDENKVALAGIHSLSLLAESALKSWSMQHGTHLLISQQEAASVRHSLYSNGQLKMSRLAQALHGEHVSCSDVALREIEKTIRFLDNQRLLGSGQEMQLHFMGNIEVAEKIKAQALQQNKLALLENMQVHELPQWDEYADTLFVEHLIQLRWPKNHYGHSNNLRIYYHQMAARVLSALALLLLLAFVVASGYLLYFESVQRNSTPRLTASAEDYLQRYGQRTGELSELQVEAVDVEYSVQALEQLQHQYRQRPQDFMRVLAEVSKGFPEVNYRAINWSVSEVQAMPYADGLGDTVTSVEAPFSATVEAVLVEDVDSPRKAIQKVNSLLLELRRQPGFTRVTTLKMPFDIASHSQFKMNSQTSKDSTTQVTFSFRIDGLLL